MSKQLTSVVIGLGQIGQGYDYNNNDESIILTHASAFHFHPEFELIAGVDPDANKRQQFEKKFSVPAYPGLDDLQKRHEPEIISLAVPTDLHYSIFGDALSLCPKAILCEKPIAIQVAEAEQMVALAEDSNCAVIVNYLRRFNPAINTLKKHIKSKKLGDIYKGTAWYTKGIVDNGSHFIDLFIFLLGEVQEIQILKHGRKWHSRDPEPDVLIRFGQTDIYMLAGREEHCCMGQFELLGTKGKIQFEDDQPIKIRYAEDDPIYPGYKNLGIEEEIENPSNRNIWFTLENLAEHLNRGSRLKSTVESSTNTLRVVERIIEEIARK